GATLRARLVDEDGAPIAGAMAAIMSGGPGKELIGSPGLPGFREFWLMGLTRVHSDADGRLEISRLWPSSFQLSIQDLLHAPRYLADLHVGAGEALDLGDVVLDRGGEVAGTVSDASGAPIPKAEVWAWEAGMAYRKDVGMMRPEDWAKGDPMPGVLEALHEFGPWSTNRSPVLADSAGHFDRPALTSHLLDLFVEAEGFEPMRVPDVAVGSQQLVLVLAPEANLEVRIVDAVTEAPLADASLQAFRCTAQVGHGDLVPTERRVTSGARPGAFVVHTIGP